MDEKKIALVTGGSRGIGRAVCLEKTGESAKAAALFARAQALAPALFTGAKPA